MSKHDGNTRTRKHKQWKAGADLISWFIYFLFEFYFVEILSKSSNEMEYIFLLECVRMRMPAAIFRDREITFSFIHFHRHRLECRQSSAHTRWIVCVFLLFPLRSSSSNWFNGCIIIFLHFPYCNKYWKRRRTSLNTITWKCHFGYSRYITNI